MHRGKQFLKENKVDDFNINLNIKLSKLLMNFTEDIRTQVGKVQAEAEILAMQKKELIESLLKNDCVKECTFCNKNAWGEELHDIGCPFEMAYRFQKMD